MSMARGQAALEQVPKMSARIFYNICVRYECHAICLPAKAPYTVRVARK